jgi:hypothetical protein
MSNGVTRDKSTRGFAALKPLAQSTKPLELDLTGRRPLYAEPDGFSPGRDGERKRTLVT